MRLPAKGWLHHRFRHVPLLHTWTSAGTSARALAHTYADAAQAAAPPDPTRAASPDKLRQGLEPVRWVRMDGPHLL